MRICLKFCKLSTQTKKKLPTFYSPPSVAFKKSLYFNLFTMVSVVYFNVVDINMLAINKFYRYIYE